MLLSGSRLLQERRASVDEKLGSQRTAGVRRGDGYGTDDLTAECSVL
jgi:hypothetical protein